MTIQTRQGVAKVYSKKVAIILQLLKCPQHCMHHHTEHHIPLQHPKTSADVHHIHHAQCLQHLMQMLYGNSWGCGHDGAKIWGGIRVSGIRQGIGTKNQNMLRINRWLLDRPFMGSLALMGAVSNLKVWNVEEIWKTSGTLVGWCI